MTIHDAVLVVGGIIFGIIYTLCLAIVFQDQRLDNRTKGSPPRQTPPPPIRPGR